MTERRAAEAPVGVFDSGVGGLTVLAALTRALPAEDFVYLGDTARLPYGTRSADSIRRYSLQAAGRLHDSGVKCLVVACNTASAIALDALAHEFAPAPVLGVLEPGAVAACRATRTGRIAVIATESTVRGGAYEAAIRYERTDGGRERARLRVAGGARRGGLDRRAGGRGRAASLSRRVVRRGGDAERPDTLLLGCTHFPVFAPLIARMLGAGVTIVDSAATTADALGRALDARNSGARPRRPGPCGCSRRTVRSDSRASARRFSAEGSRPRTSRSSIWPRTRRFCDPEHLIRAIRPYQEHPHDTNDGDGRLSAWHGHHRRDDDRDRCEPGHSPPPRRSRRRHATSIARSSASRPWRVRARCP